MEKETDLSYLSDAEVKALLAAATVKRDKAIILLILNTGIRLNELPALNINSVDWDKKLLHIEGSRKRDIPLNDEVFEALSAWSRERIDNASEALFITLRGRPKRITSRALDKLLRKYGFEAGIKKHVNAQILRHTFGVRLLSKETSIDNASAVLGVTDSKVINRYTKTAKDIKEGSVPTKVTEKLDTRPRIVKQLSKIMRTKHKEACIIKPSAPADQDETTIGRDPVLSEVKENLSKGLSTLLVGPIGIGKTHIMKTILEESLPLTKGETTEGVYISSPTPSKQFLQKLCGKYCPDWSQRLPSKTRSTTKEIVELLTNTLKGLDKKPILMIDDLDSARASDIETFIMLFDSFTILAACEETNSRLKELWWKFRRIDLQPLDREASKELIKHLSKGLVIADYALLETKILSIANGLPLAIFEMVGQVSHLPLVKKEDAREVYHEAGVRYRDWTAAVIVLWTIATSSRFINLGAQSVEGYILAVLGMAAMVGGIRFLRTR